MKKNMTAKKLEERLKKLDYDAVGFQVYTCSVEEAQNALALVKSLNPKITRIIGGAHVSGDSQNALDRMDADYAFRGEAEILGTVLVGRLALPFFSQKCPHAFFRFCRKD